MLELVSVQTTTDNLSELEIQGCFAKQVKLQTHFRRSGVTDLQWVQ